MLIPSELPYDLSRRIRAKDIFTQREVVKDVLNVDLGLRSFLVDFLREMERPEKEMAMAIIRGLLDNLLL